MMSCRRSPITATLLLLSILFCNYATSTLVFTREPSSQTVVVGRPFVWDCTAEDTENSGAAVDIRWKLGDVFLDDNHPRIHRLGNGSLYFSPVQSEDLAHYTCVVSLRSRTNSSVESRPASLRIASIDPIERPPVSQNVTAGVTVYLTCISGPSLPLATLHWEKDGTNFTDGQAYETQGFGGNRTSGTLQIDNVDGRHAGQYVCVAVNPMLPQAPERSLPATLVVEAPAVILEGPTNTTVTAGTTAVLQCSAAGTGPLELQWFKDGVLLSNDTSIQRFILSDGSLMFHSVQTSDAGSYYCTVQNPYGNATSDMAHLSIAYIDSTFLQHPSSRTAIELTPVTLTCRPPSSHPPAVITWYHDNRLIAVDNRVIVMATGDLRFAYVMELDAGEYFCSAQNTVIGRSVVSNRAQLTVTVPPVFIIHPVDTSANLYDTAQLTCRAQGSPAPTITWYKDSSLLTTSDRITFSQDNELLTITNVQRTDQGAYYCEASSSLGTVRSNGGTLDVNILPGISVGPGDGTGEIYVPRGDHALLRCAAAGDPQPTLTWYRDGQLLNVTPGDTHYRITSEGLEILGVTEADEGSYTCRAESSAGFTESTGTLRVQVPAVITTPPVNQTVSAGQPATFHCVATGTPVPTVTWLFNSGPSGTQQPENAYLQFPSVGLQHMGRYTCVAQNLRDRRDEAEAYLTVLMAPEIASLTGPRLVKLREDLRLDCTTIGSPPPTVTWFRDGQLLVTSDRVSFPSQGALLIRYVDYADEGQYTCMAANEAGEARENMLVFVQVQPAAPELVSAVALDSYSVNISWVATDDGNSSILYYQVEYKLSDAPAYTTLPDRIPAAGHIGWFVIEDLEPAESYYFQVRAWNIIGASAPGNALEVQTFASNPSEPRNLQVPYKNSTAVQLSWERPQQRNGDVRVYELQYRDQNSQDFDSFEVVSTSPTTTQLVVNLWPLTFYHFRVRAATVWNGERLWGNYSSFLQVQTNPGAPFAAPQNVQATANSSDTILVEWQEIPFNMQNGVITSYTLRYKRTDNSEDWRTKTLGRPVTSTFLSDLKPWREYRIEVQGTNAQGSGPFSDPALARTFQSAPTGAPTDVSIVGVSPTSIQVTWQPVSAEFQNGVIGGYRLKLDGREHTFVAGAENRAITIGGLRPWTEYLVEVAAVNVALNVTGLYSAARGGRTLEDVPGPISGLTVEVLSFSAVRLSWQPPATPNGVIIGYIVSYIPVGRHFPTTQKPTTVQTTEGAGNGTEEDPTDTSSSRVTRDTGPTFDLDLENATLTTMETSEPRAVLEGLYPSTVYHVQVVARTGAGAGATAVNITATTLPWYPTVRPPTTPEPPTTKTISTPDKAVTETASPPPGGSNAALLQPHDVPIVVGVCLTGGILLLAIIGWAGWKCRHNRAKARRRGSYLVADEVDSSRVSEDSIFSALKESSNRRMDRYGVPQPYMLDTVQEEPRSSSRHSTSSRRKRAPSDSSSRHSTSSRRSSRKERRLREVEHVQAQLGDMEPGSALLQLQEEPADADYPGMDNLGFSNPGYSADPDAIPPPPASLPPDPDASIPPPPRDQAPHPVVNIIPPPPANSPPEAIPPPPPNSAPEAIPPHPTNPPPQAVPPRPLGPAPLVEVHVPPHPSTPAPKASPSSKPPPRPAPSPPFMTPPEHLPPPPTNAPPEHLPPPPSNPPPEAIPPPPTNAPPEVDLPPPPSNPPPEADLPPPPAALPPEPDLPPPPVKPAPLPQSPRRRQLPQHPGIPPPATPSQSSPSSLHSNRTPPGPHPPPPFAPSQNSAFSPMTLPSTKVGLPSPTRSIPRRRPSPSDSSASRSKGRDSGSQNGSLPGSSRQSVTSDTYPSILDPSHLPSTSITPNGSPPRRGQQLSPKGHQKTPSRSSAAGSSSGRSLPDTPLSSSYSTPLSSVGRSGGKRSRKSRHSTPSGSGLSASDLEGVPPDVQELYSKVDLSKKRKNRMKRDSAAAIARALSQEGENDVGGILDDDAVVVYRERTAL
ncbi:cell adhesion molecule DSCAM-like isoform X2 [Branchiostoma floridae x Branchiostoma japonicum]